MKSVYEDLATTLVSATLSNATASMFEVIFASVA